jgi:hypothetical protein
MMQFMATEVLQGKGHTYQHDLDSFFYVFMMCVRYGHEDVDGREETIPPHSKLNEEDETNKDDHTTGLVYQDLCRNCQH